MTEQKLLIGNSLEVLKTLDPDSIDLCVTSPPYWGLRDYGSDPVIWGGEEDCDHGWLEHIEPARGGAGTNANVGANKDAEANNRGHPTHSAYCVKCGAWKGQLGLEPSPLEYIDHLVAIFDEVKRVLKPTGACWVNIGDSYSTNNGCYNSDFITSPKHIKGKPKMPRTKIVREKCLVQIPSRFAIAMCDHGWILRNECIWQKPNAMPVSVKDRFTVDFEKFFFFTKEPNYYFKRQSEVGADYKSSIYENRNKRTTWTIPTSASHEEHVAMFPVALIDTPIKACCPPGGIVLDPFCGSGTTLEYCRKHDLNAIGIEINPEFKDIIDRRSMANIGKLEDFV